MSTALTVSAADPSPSDPPAGEMLLTDDLGNAVRTPTESVAQGLRPSSAIGLKHQTPRTHKGLKLTGEVLEKLEALWSDLPKFAFFPPVPPPLMSYLYSNDEFGNTAIRPGALIDVAPFEPQVQGAKYWLSRHGLRYSLEQTIGYAGITDVVQGESNLSNYNLDFAAKWTVFDARSAGTAGWISAQIEYEAALDGSGAKQNAQTNIGALTNPTSIWSTHSGLRIPELAWQQSFFSGHIVALAGVVNQGNYIDANTYANTGRGQFTNSALINSMVLPLPAYNYGLNLQWQPSNDWYAMFGTSVGNATAGESPSANFSWEDWSLLWEVGYAPSDFLGLGPGVYRIQPFLARADGPVQGGVSFNLQQQLGHRSPFGWFGRFGVGGSQVSAGAKAQVGTGFVMQAPLKYAGWVPQLTNDLLGVGFVWSQPSASTRTVYHNNEYVFETFYTLQLTPTSQLQPDLQIVWNPAFNPDPGPAVVFQFQFVLKW
jgi:porin